jgi:hypothetical protein
MPPGKLSLMSQRTLVAMVRWFLSSTINNINNYFSCNNMKKGIINNYKVQQLQYKYHPQQPSKTEGTMLSPRTKKQHKNMDTNVVNSSKKNAKTKKNNINNNNLQQHPKLPSHQKKLEKV